MIVNIFDLQDDVLQALEASLSPERMETYVQEAGGDREKALRLYTWNTAISAAFYGPLQGLEVALRNAIHRELDAVYGPDWYDNPACGLDSGALERIDAAKRTLRKSRYPVDPPHMVAELAFGFWVSLLGSGGWAPDRSKRDYEKTLWRKCLYKAFPHARLSRKQAHAPLDYLRTFRNRIAHHEPIFDRHLKADYQSILKVSGWMCPKTRNWIEHHSRVEELLTCTRDDGNVMF